MPLETNDDQLNIKGTGGFVGALARYYSEFLATDFKKGRLPKRRFQIKDKKGRRTGIPLEKFPSFLTLLTKDLSKNFGRNLEVTITNGAHTSSLSNIVIKVIRTEIEKLTLDEFHLRSSKVLEKFKRTVKNKDVDLEIEAEKLISDIRQLIALEIVTDIIQHIYPIFEKYGSNLTDIIEGIENELADLLVEPLEELIPSAIASIFKNVEEVSLEGLITDTFEIKKLREKLNYFFEDFAAGDLFTELRELSAVEKLDDNLEFYLNIGEVKFNKNVFPIFYIPLQHVIEKGKAKLSLEPRLLVNKRAIDYISREIQEATSTVRASVIDQRIIYVSDVTTISNIIEDVLDKIILALDMNGSLSFSEHGRKLKNSSAEINLKLSIALFDKSDESMQTDYEELLQNIDESSDLFNFLKKMVGSYFTDNPNNIINEVLDEWDETKTPERLVFDTPLPLAEEQRKILSALSNHESKFIAVEGPPGTGKSHTISAIAFGAILRGQSILILSDKKEALDVVENKLNETLGKVRPSDDFINPILRLGRMGSNFTKLTSTKTIENLRTQHREVEKNRDRRKQLYKEHCEELKSLITEQINLGSNVNLGDVHSYEVKLNVFFKDYQDKENLEKIFNLNDDAFEIENIDLFSRTREICIQLENQILDFSLNFGDDANALIDAIQFTLLVKEIGTKYKVFSEANKLTYENSSLIEDSINKLKQEKGFFGYFFAGKAILEIKNLLQEELGIETKNHHPEELINQLQELSGRVFKFYQEVKENYDGAEELIIDAREIEIQNLEVKKLINYLGTVQKNIEDCLLPFLTDDETILDILSDPSSNDGEFYDRFTELRNEKERHESIFKYKDFSYLAKKTEIENYNALELASEIDARVIEFATQHKNDARALSQIIRKKMKFPKDKFELLRSAFPCMICSLRDYAEYIPLEKELFDIIIIDEASQVSIAQALPAILRSKKMVVLGDRRQFGNVKTSNASKELNSAYFAKVKEALSEDYEEISADFEVKLDTLNISNSILDFMEGMSNFTIMLKKHFRGYPEMISFSSKYFYGSSLQTMKIRGKPLAEILEFQFLEDDGYIEKFQNTNQKEADYILERLLHQLDDEDYRSVAVITPFNDQQTLISKVISNHEKYEDILTKLKFRCFTFDSCQGEERDIIYYSFVANNSRDRLWAIFPVELEKTSEEELDRNKKMQRLNVGFSRGKEKLVFVHSKPISELKSSLRVVLNHYQNILKNVNSVPSENDLDPNSEAEKKVLKWINACPIVTEKQPEVIPQFAIGEYLKSIDPKYDHPSFRVDFLLRFSSDNTQHDIIIEYDGFEFHFNDLNNVDAGNWKYYQKESDIERERILESYGYKTIRINKFNAGEDPINTLNERLIESLDAFNDSGDRLIKTVLVDTAIAHVGLQDGSIRHCKKCDQNKPLEKFVDPKLKSGIRRYCSDCVVTRPKSRIRKKKQQSTHKVCPTCKREYPLSEFLDDTNKTGRRRLCSSCKAISVRKQEQYMRRKWY